MIFVTISIMFIFMIFMISVACSKPSQTTQSQEIETTITKQLANTSNSPTNNKNSMKNEITESYFTNVTTVVEDIIELQKILSNNIDFIRYFRELPECIIMNNGGITENKLQINTLLLKDMAKCSVNLGHPLNMKSREGFGLFYFSLRTHGIDKRIDFELFNVAKEMLYEKCERTEHLAHMALTKVEPIQFPDEVFFMSNILGKYDSNLQQKYLDLLYRFASLVAKADGVMDDKEIEWLEKILYLSVDAVDHRIEKTRQKLNKIMLDLPVNQKPQRDVADKNKITEEYFTSITTEVEKVIALKKELSEDDSFLKHLNAVVNPNVNDANKIIEEMFFRDMTKCFASLGHTFDIKSKEGFGLFYFFWRTFDTNDFCKMDYEQFDSKKDVLYEKLEESAGYFYEEALKGMRENPLPDGVFWMSRVLKDYDRDLQQKYLVMLYRYASLTAKADGVVTDVEAAWLNKILRLSENPVLSIESDGKKENSASVANQPQENPIPVKPKTAELKSLIGLHSVKVEIETLTNFIKIQQQREAKGLKTSSVSYHCVFTGNPGTGKTTVARIVADIYKSLGVLVKGHLVETDRSGLVAEYVGQTAVKTNKIIDSALDGVLFIDEAYSLISESQNDYGKEAIATLLKRMEDDRSRLVVILAGYSAEMQQFIDSNPGLQSRFNRYIDFPDYSAEELYQIFEKNAQNYDYTIDSEAESMLKKHLEIEVANKGKNFGNARFVRNLFEKTIERQANRLSKEVNLTNEKLTKITAEDLAV